MLIHLLDVLGGNLQEVPQHLEHAGAALGTGLVLALHDLADLDRGLEELGGAAVEADGLALVELALAVVGGDALLLARVAQAVVGIGHDAHLALDVGNLLLRGHLGTTKTEKGRHVGGFVLFEEIEARVGR